MVTAKVFDEWKEIDGLSEGSGSSEKLWLQSPEEPVRGLFKFPKIQDYPDKPSSITTEHISEWLAAQLGERLEIECAKVDLGYRNGRIGSFSHLIIDKYKGTELIEGVSFIRAVFPKYDAKLMFNPEDNTYYCLDHILRSTQAYVSTKSWIEMLMFDFLIGNADRHQNNWALLKNEEQKYQWSPLYDNGSSLCCYVPDEKLEWYFSKDKWPMRRLTDTGSKSRIRIDGSKRSRPTHKAVMEYIFEKYPRIAIPIGKRFVEQLTKNRVEQLLSELPEEMFSSVRQRLVLDYLETKLQILSCWV